MRFSIRDLLLVTVIVALAVGWWRDRSRLGKEVERLEMNGRRTEARLSYEKAMGNLQKALAAAEEAAAKARAEVDRSNEALKEAWRLGGSSEGPVRGYKLPGPPLLNSATPAPKLPKKSAD